MAYCVNPPLMVTDLVSGGNLRQFLSSRSWPHRLGYSLLLDVAQGMLYLHAMSVIHGDLKALNVLVDGNKAVIADFGLSKIKMAGTTMGGTAGLVDSSMATRTGGTVAFMAPELFEGRRMSKASDAYAFAMLCYEVLSEGKYPFGECSGPAVGFLPRKRGLVWRD